MPQPTHGITDHVNGQLKMYRAFGSSELQKTTTFGASIAENHEVANHLQKTPHIQ